MVTRRQALLWIFGVFAAAGAIVSLIPLAASLQPSARALNDSEFRVRISSIPADGYWLVTLGGTRIVLVRDSAVHAYAVSYWNRHFRLRIDRASLFDVIPCEHFEFSAGIFQCADTGGNSWWPQQVRYDIGGKHLGDDPVPDLDAVPVRIDGDYVILNPMRG